MPPATKGRNTFRYWILKVKSLNILGIKVFYDSF